MFGDFFNPFVVGAILALAVVGCCLLTAYAMRIYYEALRKAPLYAKVESLLQGIEIAKEELRTIQSRYDSLLSEEASAKLVIAEGNEQRKWLEENGEHILQSKEFLASSEQKLADINDSINLAKEAEERIKLNCAELEEKANEAKRLISEGEMQRKWLEENGDRVIQSREFLASSEQKLADINDSINLAKEAEERIKLNCAELEEKVNEAKRLISEGEMQRKWLEENGDRVIKNREFLVSSEQKLKDINNDIASLKEAEEQLKQSALELENRAIAAQREFEKLTEQGKDLARDNEEITSSVDKLIQEYEEKQAQVENIRSEIAQCESKLKSENLKIAELREEIQERSSQRDGLLTDLESAKTRLDEVKEQHRLEEFELLKCNDKLTETIGRRDQLEKNCQELSDSITEQKRLLEESEKLRRNAEASAEAAMLEAERAKREAQEEKDRLAYLTQDREKVSKYCDEAEMKKATLDAEILAKTEELSNIRKAIVVEGKNTDKYRWVDLDSQVFADDTRGMGASSGAIDEMEWLENFQGNLNDCSIRFNPRIINAFHTGLKVSDFSPMVILAGISGTGKSLLPQLYSQAIGMQFLQIAVQPRWDGPQDMFGFYNYMEGRYKATELSRLLWQYDVYNNPAAGKKYGSGNGSPPMNLILLDEMNLARVEYYFSDMLSKLEVRRIIDANNAERRKNAEIEIECTPQKESIDQRRIFINGNNLFVGTMNEDESTQALSDKVLDRSNLLRMGQPEKLRVKPNVKRFHEIYSNAPLMMLKQWQNHWINNDINEGRANRVDEVLKHLNDQLAQVGRPFAYRVANAVQAYVNNYPVKSEQGIKDALADQIEMKVLPKLNGLDKENSKVKSVLNGIRGIIEAECGDEKLISTYEEVQKNQFDLFFKWSGVRR